MNDELRDLALEVLWSYHKTWYSWGGDDPSSMDCSGLVIEVLKSVGLFERKRDATAEGLRRIYAKSACNETTASPGCLVFWMSKDGDRAVHVEMIVETIEGIHYSMGASGGGPHVKDKESAIKNNAFVKVRPVESRGGTRQYVDPFDIPVDDESV